MLPPLRNILFFLCLSVSLPLQATTPQEMIKWAEGLNARQQEDIKKSQAEAIKIVEATTGNLDKSNKCTGACASQKITPSQETSDRYPNLLIFVSFSMPKGTLRNLANQAHRVGAKLVFRGLIGNSFVKTAEAFKNLGVEALIDPTLFKSYSIAKVPAFVLQETAPLMPGKAVKHDILYGNVSLLYAVQQFAEKGEIKDASAILSSLRGIRR